MTEREAHIYLDKTNWYELRKYATKEPIPVEIDQKRKEAYETLKRAK